VDLNNKTLVIIPAFNEEATIAKVIQDIKVFFPAADILVISDASTDNTSQAALSHSVKVIELPFNVGIGAVMRLGFRYACEFGYSYAIQVDADGQHQPQDIPKMQERLNSAENPDMVIASRFLQPGGYKSTFLRRIGIRYFSTLIFLLTRRFIYDPTSGFRMFNHRLFTLFAENYAEDYPEPESLVLALLKGFKVEEIEATMQERLSGKSSITGLKSCYYMLKVTLAILRQWLLSR